LTAKRRPRQTSILSLLCAGRNACAAPVDRYWSDLYKGKFDKGWDAYREEVFERQKKLGVIPADAKLPERIRTSRPGTS